MGPTDAAGRAGGGSQTPSWAVGRGDTKPRHALWGVSGPRETSRRTPTCCLPNPAPVRSPRQERASQGSDWEPETLHPTHVGARAGREAGTLSCSHDCSPRSGSRGDKNQHKWGKTHSGVSVGREQPGGKAESCPQQRGRGRVEWGGGWGGRGRVGGRWGEWAGWEGTGAGRLGEAWGRQVGARGVAGAGVEGGQGRGGWEPRLRHHAAQVHARFSQKVRVPKHKSRCFDDPKRPTTIPLLCKRSQMQRFWGGFYENRTSQGSLCHGIHSQAPGGVNRPPLILREKGHAFKS